MDEVRSLERDCSMVRGAQDMLTSSVFLDVRGLFRLVLLFLVLSEWVREEKDDQERNDSLHRM